MVGNASGDSARSVPDAIELLFEARLWERIVPALSEGQPETESATGQGQNRHRDLEIFKDVTAQQAGHCQRRQGVQHGARRQAAPEDRV